jgi:serine/threonine protein kinase
MTDLSGERIDRYQILEKIGEGGMATVYKAHDTRLERDVALKLIRRSAFPPEMLDNILARFEREAKSLARLSHPNIVTVHDYGEHDGAPYLVLEYCPGGDLRQRLHGKPLDWREALPLILPIARALKAAHGAGVIHRDVKPSNIMFTKDGEPKLSDFGIAKILETNEAATLTGTGVGIGTPGYMAPEQWTGETSPKSDQYGLGVVLYELLTGRKPYEADTPAGVLIKQTSQPLPLPRQHNPEIPEAVEAELVKSLSRDPAGRFADMGAFIKAFEELLTPVAATVVSTGHLKTEFTESTSGDSSELATKAVLPANKRPIGKITLIGAAILAVLAGMFWVGTQLSKGFPAVVDPTEIPSHTASATLSRKPSQAPTRTPSPTQTYTPTVTATPLPVEITDEKGVKMRLVPAGMFGMGSSHDQEPADVKPMHMVTLHNYYMDVYEVTNAQYKVCLDAGACTPISKKDDPKARRYYDPKFGNLPIVWVDWIQTKAFCEWRGARLPTEAEWEKAARGTDGRSYPWGEGLDLSFANSNGSDVTEVGKFEKDKSPYGMYDMAGNVFEWVNDWYDPTYYQYSPSEDPQGPSSGDSRVLRGGSWYFVRGIDGRTTFRGSQPPEFIAPNIGFRCARDVAP